MDTKIKTSNNVRNLSIAALFIALSYAGSYLKVFGTIAFDSLPGFLAALLIGPVYGAAIGALGHLFTAITSGFPLSVPMHLVISLTMALTMFGFGRVYRALGGKASEIVRLAAAGITGLILNAPVSLAASMAALALIAGSEAALGLLVMLPALLAASAANIVLSLILFKRLEKFWNRT